MPTLDVSDCSSGNICPLTLLYVLDLMSYDHTLLQRIFFRLLEPITHWQSDLKYLSVRISWLCVHLKFSTPYGKTQMKFLANSIQSGTAEMDKVHIHDLG